MDPHPWEETQAQAGKVIARCGDNTALSFPVGCGPTHLNFILPSSTWLPTVADVILETKAQALGWGALPQAPYFSSPGEQEMRAPLGEAALACCSDPLQCPRMDTGRHHCPCAWQSLALIPAPPPPTPPAHHGEEPRRLWPQEQLTFSNMADFWE